MGDRKTQSLLAALFASYLFAVSTTAQTADISAGNLHTVLLKSDGSVWTTGSNEYGQLGIGDKAIASKNLFVKVMASHGKAVSASKSQTFILKQDGTVWAAGLNNYGQLGIGSTEDKFYEFQETNINSVQAVAAGNHHTMALQLDGSVWSTGKLVQTNTVFTKIMGGGVKAIAAGHEHGIVLMTDGSVQTIGNNKYGQLGNGDAVDSAFGFKEVLANGVVAVFARQFQTMVIKQDGSAWGTGQNNYGALGDGSRTDRKNFVLCKLPASVKTLALGFGHTVALMNNGSIQSTGFNSDGQIGDSTTITRSSFREISIVHGKDVSVKYVTAGRLHTAVIKVDGHIYNTGSNSHGQLTGTTTGRHVFTLILDRGMNCTKGFFNAKGETRIVKFMGKKYKVTLAPSCKACDAGYFKAVESSSATEVDSCTAHTKCSAAQWIAIAGTSTQNNKCAACPAGHTCDGAKATQCLASRYVKDNKCLTCPSDSICDGAKATGSANVHVIYHAKFKDIIFFTFVRA